jgi:hypothetical protein
MGRAVIRKSPQEAKQVRWIRSIAGVGNQHFPICRLIDLCSKFWIDSHTYSSSERGAKGWNQSIDT